MFRTAIVAFVIGVFASACSQQAQQVEEAVISAEARAEIEALREAADAIDGSAEPQASIEAWTAARDKAAEHYPDGHPAIAALTLETALGHFFLGDLDQAIAITQAAIPALEAGGPDHLGALADAYNAAIVFYQYQGRFADAYPIAQKLLDLRRDEYGDTASSELAAAYSNLANLEYEFANVTRAIDLIAQSVSIAEDLDTIPPNAAPYYGNQVVYLLAGGFTEHALAASRLAAERHQQILPPGHPYQAQNLGNMANILLQTDRAAEAESIARRAVDIAAAGFGRDNHQSLYLVTVLADTLRAQGRFDAAETLYAASAEGLVEALGEDADRTLQAQEKLALLQLDVRQDRAALARLRDIHERRRAALPELHRERIGGAWRLAERAYASGDQDTARQLADEARALEERLYDVTDPRRLASAAFVAALDVSTGDRAALERARALNARALNNEVIFAGGGASAFLDREAQRDTAGWLLEAALQAGDIEIGFLAAQQLQSATTRQAVASALARGEASSPGERARIRARQDQVLRRQQLFFEYASAVRASAEALDEDRLDAIQASRERVERALERNGAPIEMQISALQDINAVQQALGPGEALLLVVDSPLRPVSILVTADDARMRAPPLSTIALQALVDRVRVTLNPQQLDRVFDADAAQQIHEALFDAPNEAMLAARDRLLVAASGPLSALPLAVLQNAASESAGEQWLGERFALVALPSIDLITAGDAQAGEALSDVVLIGAPLAAPADGAADPRSPRDAALISALPALPLAEQELGALADALAAERPVLLTGADATEQALRATVTSQVDVLAFATHGLVSAELADFAEPGLVLTPDQADDGVLTLSEVTGLQLNARWVVLSACNTASAAQARGDGLSGLVSAFLYAGADQVLATHWPVRDDVAARLTIATLSHGGDPARALQAEMRRLAAAPETAHPALWGPMIYVGR